MDVTIKLPWLIKNVVKVEPSAFGCCINCLLAMVVTVKLPWLIKKM
jgi:hypothetical protein